MTAQPPVAKLNVLLIEDNPDDVALLCEALAQCPERRFAVRHADRLATGLECLAAGPVDVVLLDLGLPDAEGMEPLDRLLAQPHAPPIVVLTGLNDDTIGIESIQRGALDFVGKHLTSPPQLARAVRSAVERQRTEAALKTSLREIEAHNRILNIFLTESDEQMYADVLAVILEVMDSKYGVFGYLDETGDLVVPTMTRLVWDKCQVADKRFVFARATWGNSTWPRAIREKRTICQNEPSTLTPKGHIPMTRHISLPLIHRGEAIGLIQVANKASDYLGADVALLELMGRLIAPVLEARLNGERQAAARQRAEDRLRQRNAELERFNRAAAGRETRMVELKQTINDLSRQLGQPPPFPLAFLEKPGTENHSAASNPPPATCLQPPVTRAQANGI